MGDNTNVSLANDEAIVGWSTLVAGLLVAGGECCQMVARGRVLSFSKPSNLLHWVRPDPSRRHRFIRSRESRNTVTTGPVGRGGLAGARKRLVCQQRISDSTTFSGSPEAELSSPLPIRWHLAPQKLADSS